MNLYYYYLIYKHKILCYLTQKKTISMQQIQHCFSYGNVYYYYNEIIYQTNFFIWNVPTCSKKKYIEYKFVYKLFKKL